MENEERDTLVHEIVRLVCGRELEARDRHLIPEEVVCSWGIGVGYCGME